MKYLPYIVLLLAAAGLMSLASVIIIYIKVCRQPRPKTKKKSSWLDIIFAQKGDESFDGNPDEILNKKNNQ